LAIIFNELARAKPKAVAMDMILSEPEEILLNRQLDGTVIEIDPDAEYAVSIEKVRGAIVPAALFSGKAITSSLAIAMLDEFKANLELEEAALVDHLTKRGFTDKNLPAQVHTLFFEVRREAVFQRVNGLLRQKAATASQTRQS